MEFSTRFISATHKFNTYFEHVAAPLFRKTFEIKKELKSAEITICGLGFYKLYMNGKDITKGMLAPYISNPDHIIYYDNYDIAPLLKDGENVIGVMLGNGMQNAPGGIIWEFDKAKWRSSPKLALNLEGEYADGEVFSFEADESFKVSDSPIWFDDLRSGTFYNALKEQNGWNKPGFDDSEWGNAFFCETPRGETRLCEAEPIVATEKIAPVSIKKGGLQDYSPSRREHWASLETPETTDGYIFDFGTNAAGVFEFKIKNAEPGRRIEFFTSEILNENGDLYTETFSNFYPKYYAQRDIYICKGGEESFIPDFTYHGYRYCLVIGLKEDEAVPETLTYIKSNSALKETGGFCCSDETANTIQKAARISDLSNFYYFPTDCPHREKNGWTGDAAVSAEHMLLNLNPEKSYLEWLRNIRKAQKEDGSLPGIVPTADWGYEWGNGPAWDSVLTYLPYFTYKYRGDKEILKENAASILRYLNYISGRRDENGLIAIGLGDWLHANRDAGKPKCPLIVTDSIISMSICSMAAEIFSALGQMAQHNFAAELRDEFRAAIRKHLVDKRKMTVLSDSQTAIALAVQYGVFEEYEIPVAVKRLVENIHRNSDLLDAGFLGGRYVFRVLADNGYADLAYKMIEGPGFPSYGFWLQKGATSLWESFYPEHLDSLNHHFWGDVSAWFISYVAGIRINSECDDISRVDIRPNFIEKLSFAEAWHNSVNGKVFVRWNKKDGKATIKINIPSSSHGRLYLPEGWVTDKGEYPCDYRDFIDLKGETVVSAIKQF